MPWCVPGCGFVLGTALIKLHPFTLTLSELCDGALPRPFVTRGWGLSTSPMASSFYSLYSRMPTCSAITFALCKFCINLVVSSAVKLMPSPMMNTSGSQRLTSGTHRLEASTRTLYTYSGANKYILLPASGQSENHPLLLFLARIRPLGWRGRCACATGTSHGT